MCWGKIARREAVRHHSNQSSTFFKTPQCESVTFESRPLSSSSPPSLYSSHLMLLDGPLITYRMKMVGWGGESGTQAEARLSLRRRT